MGCDDSDRYSDAYYRREYGVRGREEFIESMRLCNADREALIFAVGDDFVDVPPSGTDVVTEQSDGADNA